MQPRTVELVLMKRVSGLVNLLICTIREVFCVNEYSTICCDSVLSLVSFNLSGLKYHKAAWTKVKTPQPCGQTVLNFQ